MTGRHTVTELKDSTMRKWLGRLLLAIVVLIVAALLAAYLLMRGSLPQLDGNSALQGLAAPVSVQRDQRGVVTIDAASQVDAMRALGYVHAQERYFEMDLMRRAPAGELSELFGAAALDLDKRNRVHRLRARVHASLDVAAGSQRAALQAYTEGVNAGLAALRVRPWPYLLLRQTPRAWTLDDSILTGMAMYADLQDNDNQTELAAARIRAVVPAALAALLDHQGSSWDAPLFGPAQGDAVLPDAAALDLRRLPHPAATAGAEPPTPGSNNFAVDGSLTSDGRAIVADDMHLGLRAPNIWFRARLRYPDTSAPDGKVDVTGFTLPGLPAVVVGSNGHVAWAFTNSYIDTADFARIAPATPGHPQALTTHVETIRVAGAAPVRFAVRESAWGPVLKDPALQQIEAATRQWDGHASTRSASYRIVRGFRGMTIDAVEAGLLAPAKAALGKDFLPPRRAQLEGIVWPLLQQRPAHLLPHAYANWDQLLAEAARNAQTDLAAQDGALSERTWGERNTAAICHPIARALPALAKRWLCMPPDPLPGDRDMPRVQGPAFGASERMVVSPGHEQDGIVHMPGGQSGHPLSPFWGAGHDDWVHGRPTPFLPTATRYTLQLQPK
ncbi:hypothetical protein XaraCFBP7407_05805 [Xanthomonas arboricola pv. arracaciae]|uniref:penicillin acylase family protein n=1 Tax=Xanthomonas arboricola TaxID=56448 RepID=UPI000CEEE2D9|nr:hypothetical protein XaraCFBP7407_05805 [Xanthomonas arboricola pv. arracaciae]